MAAAGWAEGDRPPAQYLNFLQNQAGMWVDFLSAPDISNWTQRDWIAAGSPPVLDGHTNRIIIAVDRISTDAASVVHWAMTGLDSGDTLPTILVSQRGNGWVPRTNAPAASGAPLDLKILGTDPASSYWWLVTSGGGHLYRTAVVGGAVADNGATWSAQTLPSGPSGARSIAANGSELALIASSGGWYSTDNGDTWTAATFDAGRTGVGLDVVYDGGGWIATTDDAEIFTATSVTDLWFRAGTVASGTGGNWRLTVGDGLVVAWRRNASTVTSAWTSDDHGFTWSEVEGGVPAHTHRLAYEDGVWIAAGEGYPYLSQSNDLTGWVSLPLPIASDLSVDPDLYEVATDGATWVAVAQGYTWRSGTARDVAGGALLPGDAPASLADAGYLRGHRIASSAPSAGNVLVWSAITGWTPAHTPGPWTAYVETTTVSTSDASQTTCGTYEVPTDNGVMLEISVVATRRDRGAVSGWTLLASAANASGTVTQSTGSPVITGPSNSGVSWSVTVDVSGTSLRVRVTGQAATTIDWRATARVVGSTGP